MLLLVGVVIAFIWTVIYSGLTYEPKPPKVVVHCEGEYRVFMRGEQIEVLYDPDCLKLVKT